MPPHESSYRAIDPARECLILDQHLPEITGLEFPSSPEGAALHLPVISLTGRGDSSIRDRAYALGADACLEKPMPDDILLATIGRAAEPPSLGPRTVRSCAD